MCLFACCYDIPVYLLNHEANIINRKTKSHLPKQMHKPSPDPLSIEVSELTQIKPVIFELTDGPESEARQRRDFISAIWPDRCGRTSQSSWPQNTICFTHTHTQLSDASTKTARSVKIKPGATAWQWSYAASADLKLHIQYPTHSHKSRRSSHSETMTSLSMKPPVPSNLYTRSIINNTEKSLCLFFTSRCLVCWEYSWDQPLLLLLLVLAVPCRSIVQQRISAAGTD